MFGATGNPQHTLKLLFFISSFLGTIQGWYKSIGSQLITQVHSLELQASLHATSIRHP